MKNKKKFEHWLFLWCYFLQFYVILIGIFWKWNLFMQIIFWMRILWNLGNLGISILQHYLSLSAAICHLLSFSLEVNESSSRYPSWAPPSARNILPPYQGNQGNPLPKTSGSLNRQQSSQDQENMMGCSYYQVRYWLMLQTWSYSTTPLMGLS